MSERSIQAFLTAVKSGQIKTNEQRLYRELLFGSGDLDSLRARLHDMPHQSLTAAMSNLNDKGLIYYDDKGVYHVTDYGNIDSVVKMRDRKRYEKWVKAGKKHGYFQRQFQEDMDGSVGQAADGQLFLVDPNS